MTRVPQFILAVAVLPSVSLVPASVLAQTVSSQFLESNPSQLYLADNIVSDNQFLDAGTSIPVEIDSSNPDANLIMVVGETLDTRLFTSRDTLNQVGEVMIPAGSQLDGSFVPHETRGRDGAIFMARSVTIGTETFALDATSQPIAARRSNNITASDISGGVSTVAASIALDSLFGRIGRSTGIDSRILGGARRGLGVGQVLPTILRTGQSIASGATRQDDVILVEPENLQIALDSDFRFVPVISTAAIPETSTNAAADSGFIVARGSQLSVAAQNAGTKFVALPGENVPIELTVSQALLNPNGQVLIPQGSLIRGQLQPTGNGSDAIFVADQLTMNGRSFPIAAMTRVIRSTAMQDLNLSDLRGNVVTSPEAGAALRSLGGVGGVGPSILGGLLGRSNQTRRVIIFDPAVTSLELDSDLNVDI